MGAPAAWASVTSAGPLSPELTPRRDSPRSWAAVEARKVEAPFRPQIAGELDVGNFDDSFTAMSATMSPAPPVTASARKVFRGFSFVAPNVLYSSKLFGENAAPGPSACTMAWRVAPRDFR